MTDQQKTAVKIIIVCLVATAALLIFWPEKEKTKNQNQNATTVYSVPEQWQWLWQKKEESGKSELLEIVLQKKEALHFRGEKGGWIILNKQSNGSYTGHWKDPYGNSGTIPKLLFETPFYAEATSIGKQGDVATAKLLRLR